MISEIGSNFWEYNITKNREDLFFWQSQSFKSEYFKTGRNAIKAFCGIVKCQEKRVLIPAYTCGTVIDPFIDEGWEVGYYPINRDLTINQKGFIETFRKFSPSVVLFHSYFGFNTIDEDCLPIFCKENGVVVVEDMTQSLFSNHYIKCADYYISSFRKFLAIPDGGVLISKSPIAEIKKASCDCAISETAEKAFTLKSEYFKNESNEKKNNFRKAYQELNELIGKNEIIQDISPLSKEIIFSCNKEEIIKRRQDNYSTIKLGIEKSNVVKTVLNNDITDCAPLYYPIYVECREGLQAFLSKSNVYCPIIWPKSPKINVQFPVVEYMYNHMLCIPIDQRYGQDEMKKIVSLIDEYERVLNAEKCIN